MRILLYFEMIHIITMCVHKLLSSFINFDMSKNAAKYFINLMYTMQFDHVLLFNFSLLSINAD